MRGRVVAVLVAVALAAAATAALIAYAAGADRRAIANQQPVLVYVARARIPAGTSGEDAQNRGLIERTALPRRAVAGGAVRSLEQLGGRVAAVDIVPASSSWPPAGSAGARRRAGACSPSQRAIRRSRSPWTRPGRSPGSSPRGTASAWSCP
jgi:hypothetical protein